MENTALSGQPNVIHGQNDRGTVQLDYSASSIAGTPLFSLTIDGTQVFPPTTEPVPGAEGLTQINTEATVFGTFVYAMDATRTPLDAPTSVYGFFVPSVSVDPPNQVTFPSVLLTGRVGGFLAPGAPAQRIERAIPIQCEGRVVEF
jgi:hypothetical protein